MTTKIKLYRVADSSETTTDMTAKKTVKHYKKTGFRLIERYPEVDCMVYVLYSPSRYQTIVVRDYK